MTDIMDVNSSRQASTVVLIGGPSVSCGKNTTVGTMWYVGTKDLIV
jgi:uncharacterized NAD-dependent epimerase/dehydratase family protein